MTDRQEMAIGQERISKLPPKEHWLIEPGRKIQTPQDGRGLVVVDELVEQVKACIANDYEWRFPPDVHHLYWPREEYESVEELTDGVYPARTFREVGANKILVPRDFHELIHAITVPPDMPAADVMRPYIAGWAAARKLFETVQGVTRSERQHRRRLLRDDLTEEERLNGQMTMERKIARQSRGIEQHLGELVLVPEEFRPVDPTIPLQHAAGQIGEMVLRGWQRQTRAVRLVA